MRRAVAPERSSDPGPRPFEPDITELEEIARRARRLLLTAVNRAQAGHLGGPLSVTDILVALFFDAMRIDPANPGWAERDRFVLSKGHSCVALYAVMALRGYLPVAELDTFDELDSRLQGHPDMTRLPALDMSTGSLGQGFSAAIGIALGARHAGLDAHTWVVLGDGECQEGQVWEGAQVAARYGLGGLTAIVDANGLQQYGWPAASTPTGRAVPLDDLAAKWRAFGWAVDEVDGHDLAALCATLQRPERPRERPRLVIARTVKGRGVSFMENNPEWHARPLGDELLSAALAELA
jgi:transketolase